MEVGLVEVALSHNDKYNSSKDKGIHHSLQAINHLWAISNLNLMAVISKPVVITTTTIVEAHHAFKVDGRNQVSISIVVQRYMC